MTGFIFCARCKHRSPAGSPKCEKCGHSFGRSAVISIAKSAEQAPPKSAPSPVPPSGEWVGGIYRPKHESEFLPGTPPWLLLYAIFLGGMALVWLAVIVSRFSSGERVRYYGEIILIDLGVIAASVFALLVAFGVARLKKWGWRLATGWCYLWIGASALVWLYGLLQIREEGTILFLLCSVVGLSGFAGINTAEQFLAGVSVQDMFDPKLPGFMPRRIYIPANSAVFVVGSALAYLILPVAVILISAFAMFVVLSLAVLHPPIWSQSNRIWGAAMGLILVGGAINHLLLAELLQYERPRFYPEMMKPRA
jgi:hypothetical protein